VQEIDQLILMVFSAVPVHKSKSTHAPEIEEYVAEDVFELLTGALEYLHLLIADRRRLAASGIQASDNAALMPDGRSVH
jgi:hypothetical protein